MLNFPLMQKSSKQINSKFNRTNLTTVAQDPQINNPTLKVIEPS